MKLDEIDKTGLIRESYRIEGISAEECRSIFLDWALKLPAGVDDKEAVRHLLAKYAEAYPDHPMTGILTEGLANPQKRGRRGGYRARAR